MNGYQMAEAFMWMLSEAQSYEGAKWIDDPHEAARLIVSHFDELKALNSKEYDELMAQCRDYTLRGKT